MGLMEKLNYLKETKSLFRNKIDPDGTKITDETPFRDYVDLVGSGSVNPLWNQGGVFNEGLTSYVYMQSYYSATYYNTSFVSGSTLDELTIYYPQHIDVCAGGRQQTGATSFTTFSYITGNFPWVRRLIFKDVTTLGDKFLAHTITTLDLYNTKNITATYLYITNVIIRNSDCVVNSNAFSSNLAGIYVYAKDYEHYVSVIPSSYTSKIKKIEDYPDICG